MAENAYHRTPQERRRDMALIARLFLRGYSYPAIQEEVNTQRTYSLHVNTIRNDVKAIEAEWRKSYLVDMNAVKAQELARLFELENQYWEGWHRSQAEETVTEQQQSKGQTAATDKSAYQHNKLKKVSKNRDGSVDFLQGVERCIRLRLEIYGLGGKQVTINWREEAKKAGLRDDDLNQQFEEMVKIAYDALGRDDESGGDTGG